METCRTKTYDQCVYVCPCRGYRCPNTDVQFFLLRMCVHAHTEDMVTDGYSRCKIGRICSTIYVFLCMRMCTRKRACVYVWQCDLGRIWCVAQLQRLCSTHTLLHMDVGNGVHMPKHKYTKDLSARWGSSMQECDGVTSWSLG